MRFFNLPSPIEQLNSMFLRKHGVELWLKRDDLIHPDISGNKWRKLKYNIAEADKRGIKKILTFGGAFSNHIAATAAAGNVSEGVDPNQAAGAATAGVNAGVSASSSAEAAAAGATSIGSGVASTQEETGNSGGPMNKGGLMKKRKKK